MNKGLSEPKILKESINTGFLETLLNSKNKDLSDFAKSTLEVYNKLLDKYYYGNLFNFSERLTKCFSNFGIHETSVILNQLDDNNIKCQDDWNNLDELGKKSIADKCNVSISKIDEVVKRSL